MIALLSDSSCDLPSSCIKEYHIELVPFYVSFDTTTYFKEITELSIEDFYKKLRAEKIYPKTSLPSINDYYERFENHIKLGEDVICVTLSNHFSGSYTSAVNAKDLILEKYPNAHIEIINSLNATGGEGLLVLEIAKMIQNGLDFTKIIDIAKKVRDTGRIFFFVETLDYLEHGGRIGKASALLGTMLNVKPIITLEDGQLAPICKVRGSKKALAKILELTKNHVGQHSNDYEFITIHGDNLEYAKTIYDALAPHVSMLNTYSLIGTTIGVYTGPDVIGIGMIKKYETFL